MKPTFALATGGLRVCFVTNPSEDVAEGCCGEGGRRRFWIAGIMDELHVAGCKESSQRLRILLELCSNRSLDEGDVRCGFVGDGLATPPDVNALRLETDSLGGHSALLERFASSGVIGREFDALDESLDGCVRQTTENKAVRREVAEHSASFILGIRGDIELCQSHLLEGID